MSILSSSNNLEQQIEILSGELKNGNIVCIPTETVYGLAVDASNMDAIDKLYRLKGRHRAKPMAIAISTLDEIERYIDSLNPTTEAIIKAFWPGPLTLLLSAKKSVPYQINLGSSKIGLRYSSCEITRKILQQVGRAVCLTSANLSGEKDGTIAQEIDKTFNQEILILENDEVVSGRSSTILDLSEKPYKIIRQGIISETELVPYYSL